MRSFVTVFCLATLCACFALKVQAQTPRTLWTKNPHIRVAPFRVLFVHSRGFPTTESIATSKGVQSLITTFNNDLADISDNDPTFRNVSIANYQRAEVNGFADLQKEVGDLAKQLQSIQDEGGAQPVALVYLLAHGNRVGDPKNPQIKIQLGSGGQNNPPTDRDVIVREVENTLRPVARFVVLITDNCSVGSAPVAGGNLKPESKSPSGVWRALYFGHTGMVDINTSSPTANNGQGEFAVSDGQQGSLFLLGFRRALTPESLAAKIPDFLTLRTTNDRRSAVVDYFNDKKNVPGAVADGVVSWDEFSGHLRNNVSEYAKKYIGDLPPDSSLAQTLQGADPKNAQTTQTVVINASKASILNP